jgi:hypothetical protein
VGTIETKCDPSRNLTVAKATGMMTSNDFLDWTADYYSGTTTLFVLWDLSEANLSEINTGNIRDDAKLTKSLADKRKGGKTAIVSGNSLEYGISRMLETFYEMEEVPFEVQVFYDIDKAMEWLGIMQTDYHGYKDR